MEYHVFVGTNRRPLIFWKLSCAKNMALFKTNPHNSQWFNSSEKPRVWCLGLRNFYSLRTRYFGNGCLDLRAYQAPASNPRGFELDEHLYYDLISPVLSIQNLN